MALLNYFSRGVFVAAIVFGSALEAHAKTDTSFEIKGVVISISDGDTLNLRNDADGATVIIRFSDIDAPEIGHGQDRPGQPYGIAARDFLRSKVALFEEATAKCYELDARGRSVCRIYTSRGIDLNLAMVSAGYAQAYRRYLRDTSLIDVETLARQQRLGIWSDGVAVAPETWRRICWNVSERQSNPWCIEETLATDLVYQKPGNALTAHSDSSRFGSVSAKYSALKKKTTAWLVVRRDKVVSLFAFIYQNS